MPYQANIIAYAFVKKGIEENKPVTQMKLQKLVFFAHGVYMAFNNNTPLIQEDFEAWQFGPVVGSIYLEYKTYGNQPINRKNPDLENRLKDLYKDEGAMVAINYTWNVTKNLSASTLSNWTHTKGSPWETFYTPGLTSVQIDNLAISKYFKQLLESANDARQPATPIS
ncbi:MAG: type II toxin-antitoxin system antitoxin SocA domain-containing protein [Ginsengibacter sp.]